MRKTAIESRCFGLVALVLIAASASAQDRSQYPTHRNASSSGIDWIGFYDRADAETAKARDTLRHRLNLAYGDDPKQKLDVYMTGSELAGPVFVFIHGGGFVEGDRSHYGFVAKPLAAKGIVTVVMSYRLAPAHYPAQVEDVQRTLKWVYNNISDYGGDPNRIFVGGHSAGAILSAFVSVHQQWLKDDGLPETLIDGFVAVSGPYDLRERGGFVDNYLPDAGLRREASPMLNIRNASAKAIVAAGSLEAAYVQSSKDFAQAYRGAGGQLSLMVLEEHNHPATALALGSADSPLTAAVLKLITTD